MPLCIALQQRRESLKQEQGDRSCPPAQMLLVIPLHRCIFLKKTSRQMAKSGGQRERLTFFNEADHATTLLCSGSFISPWTGILRLSTASISKDENPSQIFSGGETIGMNWLPCGLSEGLLGANSFYKLSLREFPCVLYLAAKQPQACPNSFWCR